MEWRKKIGKDKKESHRLTDTQPISVTVSKTLSETKIESVKSRGDPLPVLTVIEGPEIGHHLVLDPDWKKITIGRLPDSDLILDDESVSRKHAELEIKNDEAGSVVLKLKDLRSLNGTYLNGSRVKKAEVVAGDRIHFGDVLIRFDVLDPLDANFQKMLAEQAAVARIDPLTGLLSKRCFLEDMPGLVAFCVKKEKPLALLMADIDHFKRINDTLGHQKGDQVLKLVAQQILSVIRRNDLAVRYGGEEILLFLRGDFQAARHVAERVRTAVTQADYSHVDQKLQVTISIGGTTIRKADSLSDMIERADKALYRAKDKGRNRVEWDTEK